MSNMISKSEIRRLKNAASCQWMFNLSKDFISLLVSISSSKSSPIEFDVPLVIAAI